MKQENKGIVNSGFIQNLKVLECLWNWKQKFKALNALEFVKKYLKVLKFLLLNLVSGYFLKLFDIQNGHFVELILHVHIWQSCLKLIKVAFWTTQRQILLISNPFLSVFSPWICWYMALNVLVKSLNLNRPHMYEPCELSTIVQRMFDNLQSFSEWKVNDNVHWFHNCHNLLMH
jgi:hypothetical protein